jgi:hypothetical protein
MKRLLLSFISAATTLAFSLGLYAQPEPTGGSPVGTWQLASAKYSGQEFTIPTGERHVKIITPTHFVWVAYGKNNVITSSMGGSCSFKDGKYTEVAEFCLPEGMKDFVGKTQSFTVRVEGSKLYQSGKLSNGIKIDEVWERVKGAEK